MLGGPWKGPTLYTQPACSDQFRVSICTSKPQPASPHNGYKSGPSLLSLSELSPPFPPSPWVPYVPERVGTWILTQPMMAARVGSPGSPVQVGLYDVDYAERKPPGNSGEDGRFAHKLATVHDMGVSKNRGAPKWMVYNGKNPIKMDDLGGTTIFGNIHISEKQSTNNSKWWNLLKFFKVALGDAEGTFFPFFTLVVTDWRSGRFEATEFATLPATSAFHTDSTLPTTTVLPPNTTWAQQNTILYPRQLAVKNNQPNFICQQETNRQTSKEAIKINTHDDDQLFVAKLFHLSGCLWKLGQIDGRNSTPRFGVSIVILNRKGGKIDTVN